MRALPQRIRVAGPGGETDVDPTAMPADVSAALTRLLDEMRAPVPADAAGRGGEEYDVVLEYGDRQERLRYEAGELPPEVREALDSLLRRGP